MKINTWEKLIKFASNFEDFENIESEFNEFCNFTINNFNFSYNGQIDFWLSHTDFYGAIGLNIKEKATYQEMADLIKIIGIYKN